MAHALRIELRGAYLHATVSGDNTPQDVREYLAEVREACRAAECPRVLIEENLAGVGLGFMDVFTIAASAPQGARGAVRRIAYLDVNPDHAAERMRFAESVAVNRGVNVRVFTDRGEAERWLSA